MQVRLGMQQLATRLQNPSAIIQAAIPAIFKNVPESFHARTIEVFESNAKTCFSILSKLPGLKPIMPAGSMFIMVRNNTQLNFFKKERYIGCLIIRMTAVHIYLILLAIII